MAGDAPENIHTDTRAQLVHEIAGWNPVFCEHGRLSWAVGFGGLLRLGWVSALSIRNVLLALVTVSHGAFYYVPRKLFFLTPRFRADQYVAVVGTAWVVSAVPWGRTPWVVGQLWRPPTATVDAE